MLTLELKRKFSDLAGQLSPENLTCDGELTRAQISKRLKAIKSQWKALEKEAGETVDEGATWDWHNELMEADRLDRQAEALLQPQNPLVRWGNPGVWVREGKNKMSAYYIHNAKMRGNIKLGGIDLNAGAVDEYILYSEFAHIMNRKEEIGRYASLDEAVDAGEEYLKTINLRTLQEALPLYRPENLVRVMERMPAFEIYK